MKKVSPILSIVSLVAVAVLYVLHFTTNSSKAVSGFANDTTLAPVTQDGIVYVNIDTILSKYDMYLDIEADLTESIRTSEAELMGKEKALRKEIEDFKYKIDRGLVTRAEAGELQQTLMQKEQALVQLQSEMRMQLAEKEQVAQRKVLNSIMEYLKSLEEDGATSYQFVLGTNFGGNVLYAHDNMNITQAVINGLNADYAKTKE